MATGQVLMSNNDSHPVETRLRGIKILVVDDDQDTQILLQFILEESGAIVTVVSSAPEALAALRNSRPDLILSDLAMPEMDGYRLVQEIRSLPSHQGGAIPIIALTAYAREEDQRQAVQSGFQDFMTKPIDPSELILRLLQHCKQR